MASLFEFAYMANDAYAGPDGNVLLPNQAPQGWVVLNPGLNPNEQVQYNNPVDNGFHATAYRKSGTSEVVIAYRGTSNLSEILTDSRTIAGGDPIHQMVDAYRFYLVVLAAIPNAQVSFTGHSLGGALAGFMAAHTGLEAVTFAPAPFAVASTEVARGYEFPDGPIIPPAREGTPNEGTQDPSKIVNYRIDNEVLDNLFPPAPERYFQPMNFINAGLDLNNGYLIDSNFSDWDSDANLGLATAIHSMQLHAFLLYNPVGETYSAILPRFVPQLVNTNIAVAAGFGPSNDDLMLQTLLRQASLNPGNSTLDVFLNKDMKVLADADENSDARNDAEINTALLQFAIQHAGETVRTGGTTDGILTNVDGTIRVDIKGEFIDVNEVIGKNLLVNYISSDIAIHRRESEILRAPGISAKFLAFEHFFVDGSPSGLNASGTAGVDLFFGDNAGNVTDQMKGLAGDDVLLGRDGDDVLDGGDGGDILFGGRGADTYVVSDGDIIFDLDDEGIVKFGSNIFNGGTRPPRSNAPYDGRSDEKYKKKDGNIENRGDLEVILPNGAGKFIIKDWKNGALGITLAEEDESRQGFNLAGSFADPLVLDLDGDGLELTALGTAPSYFDLDGDGFAQLTGWVGPDDGLLAIDFDADGLITRGEELFGYSGTVRADELPLGAETSGFAELALLDANGDQIIDAADPFFPSLLVWRDVNQDGKSAAGELFTLAELGIASLDTQFASVSDVVADNIVADTGSFTFTGGVTSTLADVWFAFDPHLTVFRTDAPIDADVLALPDLTGYGRTKDLHRAMSEDPLLREMVTKFTQTTAAGAHTLAAQAEAIIARWHGVDGISPQSRGEFVNGRHLAALEALAGESFRQAELFVPDGWSNPRAMAGAVLTETWQGYLGNVTARLLAQSPLGQTLFPQLSYAQRAFLDIAPGTLLPDVLANMETNAPATLSERIRYWHSMALVLESVRPQFGLADADYIAAVETTLTAQGVAFSYESLSAAKLGSDGNDALRGTGVIPTTVFNGDDLIFGGLGDDFISPGSGADTYLYFSGDGNDRIYKPFASFENDRLRFLDLLPGEVNFKSSNDLFGDLIIEVIGTGEAVTIDGVFRGTAERSLPMTIEFADGSIKSLADLTGIVTATAGDDVLMDWAVGSTLLDGGAGNDTLVGGGGDNTYIFGRGYGIDVIVDAGSPGTDRVVFTGLTQAEVAFKRTDSLTGNLIAEIIGTNDRLTVSNQYIPTGGRIDFFEFTDGTLTAAEILAPTLLSTAGDDTIFGTVDPDTLSGGDGNDRLEGGFGDDTLSGGDGNDRLEGSSGDDTLNAGAGDDILFGGQGDDILQAFSGGQDVLRGGAGSDIYTISLPFSSPVPDTVVISDPDGGISSDNDLDTVQLPGALDDYSISREEATGDILFVRNTDSATVRITQASTIEQYEIGGADGIVWTDADLSQEIIRQQILAGNTTILGTIGDDVITGTAADEILLGEDGNDTLAGAGGNDLLKGGLGNDAYLFGQGDGVDVVHDDGFTSETNRVEFGVTRAMVNATVKRGTVSDFPDTEAAADPTSPINYIEINVAGTPDTLIVLDRFLTDPFRMITEYRFSDGEILTNEQLRNLIASGTPDDDIVMGRDTPFFDPIADNTLDGGAGNDLLIGLGGSDTYVFGRGYGSDVILDERLIFFSTDIVSFTADVLPTDVVLSRTLDAQHDLVISIQGTNDTLTIPGQFLGEAITGATRDLVIDKLVFASGQEWTGDFIRNHFLMATAGDDELFGSSEDDTLDGLGGNDLLVGGNGNDTYVFGIGAGQDTVVDDGTGRNYDPSDPATAKPEVDIVRFGAGITLADLTFIATGADLSDMKIRINGTTDELFIQDQLDPEPGFGLFTEDDFGVISLTGVDEFHFDQDGTVLSRDQVAALVTVLENQGDNVVSTDDAGGILDGGPGNDLLRGGGGDDTYIFDQGYGEEQIVDAGGFGDTVSFSAGVPVNLLKFSRSTLDSNDLIIEVGGPERLTLTIISQFVEENSRIEHFQFSDGTVLDWRDVQQEILNNASTEDDDVITGFVTGDVIRSRGGADTLTGLEGDDLIDGGDGRDIAIFRGKSTDYLVTVNGNTTIVEDLAPAVDGDDGRDTLFSVEKLIFEGDSVTNEIVPPNQVPVAEADSLSVTEDTTLITPAAALLANDSDADGQALSITQVSDAAGGLAWINLAGDVVFEPNADFNGAAGFTYTISDGDGGTASTGVTVTVTPVNDAPLAVADAVATDEDVAATFLAATLLGNDSDADLDVLRISGVANALGGTAQLTVAGDVLFTPDANFFGTAGFDYTITDDQGGFAAAAVSVDVASVNDPPVAAPDSFETVEDIPLIITQLDLLANDSDVEGQQLFVVDVVNGAGGTAGFDANGDVLFTPAADFTGTADFNYIVWDVEGGEASGTVTVTVTPGVNRDPLPTILTARPSVPDGTTSAQLWDDGVQLSATDGLGNAAKVAFQKSGFGVDGGRWKGEIDYDPATGTSEKLVIDFGGPVNDVTLQLAQMFLNEGGGVNHETGLWRAYDAAGNLVSSGRLDPTDGNLLEDSAQVSAIPIATDAAFASLEIEATDYGNGAGGGTGNNSSDFNLESVVYHRLLDPGVPPRIDNYAPGALDLQSTDDFISLSALDGAGAPGEHVFDNGGFGVAGGRVNDEIDYDPLTDSSETLILDFDGDVRNVALQVGQMGSNDVGRWFAFDDQGVQVAAGTLDQADGTSLGTTSFFIPLDTTATFSELRIDARPALPAGTEPFEVDFNIEGIVFERLDDPGAANAAPIAADDTFSTPQDTALVITPAELLANDADPDGDTLHILSADGAVGGTVEMLASHNELRFTPDAGFVGDASFSYTTGDGKAGLASATVTVSVTAPGLLPIILDLDGDGAELVAPEEGVLFDLTGQGDLVRTGWVGRDDALLVLDRNGDGKIRGVSEISFLQDSPGATSDLAALAAFDSNNDGVFDSNDDDFGDFQIWQDITQDGISQKWELRSLIDAGIASIDLTLTPTGEQALGADKNVIVNTSSYTRADGSSSEVADVVFAYQDHQDMPHGPFGDDWWENLIERIVDSITAKGEPHVSNAIERLEHWIGLDLPAQVNLKHLSFADELLQILNGYDGESDSETDAPPSGTGFPHSPWSDFAGSFGDWLDQRRASAAAERAEEPQGALRWFNAETQYLSAEDLAGQPGARLPMLGQARSRFNEWLESREAEPNSAHPDDGENAQETLAGLSDANGNDIHDLPEVAETGFGIGGRFDNGPGRKDGFDETGTTGGGFNAESLMSWTRPNAEEAAQLLADAPDLEEGDAEPELFGGFIRTFADYLDTPNAMAGLEGPRHSPIGQDDVLRLIQGMVHFDRPESFEERLRRPQDLVEPYTLTVNTV